MQNSFSYIDLFAGIGGFKMALDSHGGISAGFSEINEDAISAYTDNYQCRRSDNFGDITTIKSLPQHDMLTAGVPCQSWSIAGRNLGFNDDRGQLWNDTIYLLNETRPKCFIFENVKGLADPRNKDALAYILKRIKDAGYYADYYILNSHDYGVPQNRIRIYIIGFEKKEYFEKFKLPDIVDIVDTASLIADIFKFNTTEQELDNVKQLDFFGKETLRKGGSISSTNGYNDYFLFNDIRNGFTTIHSWDIIETNDKQKQICLLLLKNRRKSHYGPLDGNPLSYEHLSLLNPEIKQGDLDGLVLLGILKEIQYTFLIQKNSNKELSESESLLLEQHTEENLTINELKTNKAIKIAKVSITKTIQSLIEKEIVSCIETRYDFKNTKISSGLFGVNRIFMPSTKTFPTLVASDTHDYIATENIIPKSNGDYKAQFLKQIYFSKKYRKITKQEACAIQGFPRDFKLPENRGRWMKLIGNSVSVPIIEKLVSAIQETGVLKKSVISSLQKKQTG
jgi:DNA (cytosine-5)-methyltransferase 1